MTFHTQQLRLGELTLGFWFRLIWQLYHRLVFVLYSKNWCLKSSKASSWWLTGSFTRLASGSYLHEFVSWTLPQEGIHPVLLLSHFLRLTNLVQLSLLNQDWRVSDLSLVQTKYRIQVFVPRTYLPTSTRESQFTTLLQHHFHPVRRTLSWYF